MGGRTGGKSRLAVYDYLYRRGADDEDVTRSERRQYSHVSYWGRLEELHERWEKQRDPEELLEMLRHAADGERRVARGGALFPATVDAAALALPPGFFSALAEAVEEYLHGEGKADLGRLLFAAGGKGRHANPVTRGAETSEGALTVAVVNVAKEKGWAVNDAGLVECSLALAKLGRRQPGGAGSGRATEKIRKDYANRKSSANEVTTAQYRILQSVIPTPEEREAAAQEYPPAGLTPDEQELARRK